MWVSTDPKDSDISVIPLDSLLLRYFSQAHVNFATHTHREFMNYTLLFWRVNSIFSCNKFDLNVIFDLKTPHMPRYCRQLQTY